MFIGKWSLYCIEYYLIILFRIGRTGRCGNTGRSTSFYDEIDDAPLAPALVKTLSDAQQEVSTNSKNGN